MIHEEMTETFQRLHMVLRETHVHEHIEQLRATGELIMLQLNLCTILQRGAGFGQ
jgi:hypothetical protein